MEEYEIVTHQDYEVVNELTKEIAIRQMHNIEESKEVMPNTYDIDYCIKLLKVILDQCYAQRLTPNQLYFTLDYSLRKMISSLEYEKRKM